jgi:hypothetical protein
MSTAKGFGRRGEDPPERNGKEGACEVALYIGESGTAGEMLLDAVKAVVRPHSLEVTEDIGSLEKWIERPGEWSVRRIAVIFVSSHQLLERLQSYRRFLSSLKLILVLPDDAETTLSLALLLRPRFYDFAGRDCRHVADVLGKIMAGGSAG